MKSPSDVSLRTLPPSKVQEFNEIMVFIRCAADHETTHRVLDMLDTFVKEWTEEEAKERVKQKVEEDTLAWEDEGGTI